MLIPSGSAWMTSTCAPGRREDLRPDGAARAVGAVEDDPEAAGLDRRRQAEPVRRGRHRAERRPSTIRPSSALPTPPSSSVRQISCSSSSSTASSSLSPASSSTLRPLSSAGLCDAETMIPAANVPCPARNASAGVGTTPTTWTSTPRLVAPAAIAATNMSPERRVSWPTTMAPPRPTRCVGDRPAEGIGGRRLEVDVGDAADAVGAEQAGHRGQPPLGCRRSAATCAVMVTVTVDGRGRRRAWSRSAAGRSRERSRSRAGAR